MLYLESLPSFAVGKSNSKLDAAKFTTNAPFLTQIPLTGLGFGWIRGFCCPIHHPSRPKSVGFNVSDQPFLQRACATGVVMDITTMLNSKGPTASVDSEHQYSQLSSHLNKAVHLHSRMGSDTGSDVGNNSDHSSVYSSRSTKALQALPHMPNGLRYPSPSQLQHPIAMLASGYPPPNLGLENGYAHGPHRGPEHHRTAHFDDSGPVSGGNDSVKAFACTTCNKGFARRSDLARHGEHCIPAGGNLWLIRTDRTDS